MFFHNTGLIRSVPLVLLHGSRSGLCFPDSSPVLLLVKVCIPALAALTCTPCRQNVELPQIFPKSNVIAASIRGQCFFPRRRNIAEDFSAQRRGNAIPNQLKTVSSRSGEKSYGLQYKLSNNNNIF